MKKQLMRCLICMLCAVLMAVNLSLAEEAHVLLQNKNSGACTALTGDVTIAVVLVDVPEAPWDEAAVQSRRECMETLAERLEADAEAYGAQLNVTVEYYSAAADSVIRGDDVGDWPQQVLDGAAELIALRGGQGEWAGYRQTAVCFCLNTDGRAFKSSFAQAQVEYIVLYQKDAWPDAYHEMMHVFGARDYYIQEDINAAAKQHAPDSMMLTSGADNRVDSLTAYVIGWMEETDAAAQALLDETAHVTKEDVKEAKSADAITGYGVKEKDTYVYCGYLEFGSRTGWGMIEWTSGDRYLGEWQSGYRTGKGTYVWDNGNIYMGDFVDDARTGKGAYNWANGDMYAGDYVDGERTGKGTYIWSNGNMYAGDFVNGKRTGKGVLTWQNGTVYIGDFMDGQCEGYGTLYKNDGTVLEGRWEQNEYIGK